MLALSVYLVGYIKNIKFINFPLTYNVLSHHCTSNLDQPTSRPTNVHAKVPPTSHSHVSYYEKEGIRKWGLKQIHVNQLEKRDNLIPP